MLKVYFTASTSIRSDIIANYRLIIDHIKKNGCELLSGEQIINPDLLAKDKSRTKKEIFEREKSRIVEADCLIAEVTKPSLGVGSEIEYALAHQKKILALVTTDDEERLSPLIAGNPSPELLVEHYNEGRLPFIVKDFIRHIETIKQRKGKLIVIDGSDGSGKTTQANMLVSYLKRQRYPTKYFDFPQYYTSFHGKMVGKFLRGDFGDIGQVSPYLASLTYALDRASVKREMDEFLKKGGYIVANRYATSSMAHQAAKFTSESDREEFLKWLYDLEYKVHKMPRENIVIYLYVPVGIARRLTEKKGERHYLRGLTKDIHEKDETYLTRVQEMYLTLAKRYKHWRKIDCTRNGNILPADEIQQKIIQALAGERILS